MSQDNKAMPPAGDVKVIQTFRSVVGGINGLSWEYFSTLNLPKPSKHGEVIELVDGAHVTRLTAERDALKGEVEFLMRRATELKAERDAMQSELTKARELLQDARSSVMFHHDNLVGQLSLTDDKESYRARIAQELNDKAKSFLAHQSTPTAKGGE